MLQQVIQSSNDAQILAVAQRDTSPMAATATSDYYQFLSKAIRQNLDAGIVEVHLDTIRWVAVSVNGNTASVADFEKWRIKYSDGRIQWQDGSWVYTLVPDNGAWKISKADSVIPPPDSP
jgi:hypothetical protein